MAFKRSRYLQLLTHVLVLCVYDTVSESGSGKISMQPAERENIYNRIPPDNVEETTVHEDTAREATVNVDDTDTEHTLPATATVDENVDEGGDDFVTDHVIPPVNVGETTVNVDGIDTGHTLTTTVAMDEDVDEGGDDFVTDHVIPPVNVGETTVNVDVIDTGHTLTTTVAMDEVVDEGGDDFVTDHVIPPVNVGETTVNVDGIDTGHTLPSTAAMDEVVDDGGDDFVTPQDIPTVTVGETTVNVDGIDTGHTLTTTVAMDEVVDEGGHYSNFEIPPAIVWGTTVIVDEIDTGYNTTTTATKGQVGVDLYRSTSIPISASTTKPKIKKEMDPTPSNQTTTKKYVSTEKGVSTEVIQTITQIDSGNIAFVHSDVRQLLDDIFKVYDKRIRPRENQARFVNIETAFVPLKLIDFDTLENNFTVLGYFKMKWRDDFLTWTPEEYGNAMGIRISANNMWIPKLCIAKCQSRTKTVGNMATDLVSLTKKGYAQWYPGGIYSVLCEINIEYFPFDEQLCTLTYYIADEDFTTIKLQLLEAIDMSEFAENSQWDVKNVTSEVQLVKNNYVIHVNFTINRRAGFAMYTLLVPAFMMSTLCCCTFLVPVETGEKGSIAVNVFLACIVYVTIVTQNVPKNSVALSYFVLYIVHLLGMSALLTLYTMVQSYLYNCGNDKRCLSRFSMICKQQIQRRVDFIAFTMSGVVTAAGCTTMLLVLLNTK